MELYEKIVKANNEIKTINLKGKQYAEVKERIIAFRKVYPKGCIETDFTFTDNYVVCKARVLDEEKNLLGTGTARELLNRPFALECAESSAIGRCIGIGTSLGISESLSSFEDMQEVVNPSEAFEDDPDYKAMLIKKFNSLDLKKQAVILNACETKDINSITSSKLARALKTYEK